MAAKRVHSQEHHPPRHPSRGGPTRAAGARGAWLGTKRGGSRAGAMSGCREYLKGTTHGILIRQVTVHVGDGNAAVEKINENIVMFDFVKCITPI